MSDLIFPLTAVLGTFLLLIPFLTLVSYYLLVYKRKNTKSWTDFGVASNYALIIAPTSIPLFWLISSALHQSEPNAPVACYIGHTQSTSCNDSIYLLLFVTLSVVLAVLWHHLKERPSHYFSLLSTKGSSYLRIKEIVNRDSRLASLNIALSDNVSDALSTFGWLQPRIIINTAFVNNADNAMIHASLLHEKAHIKGFDTLRAFIARLALSLNPLGFLLLPEFAYWQSAREALCDSEAVLEGGEPLALAESIVFAARFPGSNETAFGLSRLCGFEHKIIKLRVALLMYGPTLPKRSVGQILLIIVLAIVVFFPHMEGFGALEHFHYIVERTLHLNL